MRKAIEQFFISLDKLVRDGQDEVFDTDVITRIQSAIRQTLVEPVATYQLPDAFGMFTPEGDRRVKAILARFLADPEVIEEAKKLPTVQQRLDAFSIWKYQ